MRISGKERRVWPKRLLTKWEGRDQMPWFVLSVEED
nr:hypothetical protein I308_06531 [Cryptococcus tetragattii IND107]